MDFMLGSDYENIRPLDAKGGMGDLFRAHKKGLDVEVVIKRIKRKYIGRLDQQNEANILKGLKHQYLPRIYDVIPGEDGCLYTIMDYIPGVDLQQYVKQNGRVPQPLAHRWACQLCEVVAYLHAQTPPILHCDIKPHNIMITGQGDICLIDFNTSLVFQGRRHRRRRDQGLRCARAILGRAHRGSGAARRPDRIPHGGHRYGRPDGVCRACAVVVGPLCRPL